MKARRFFRFISEGQRVHSIFVLEQLQIATAPHMKPEDMRPIVARHELASEDPIDAWSPDLDHSGIDRLDGKGF